MTCRFPSCARVLFAALSLAAAACQRDGNRYVAPPPPPVTVAHPIEKDVVRHLVYSGTVDPYESVELRARVPGFLEQVAFQPGARVRKGDLLFVVDRRQYAAAVERAEARVLSAEAAFHAAESDASIAEDLAKQRAGSEIDRIVKQAQRESARAAIRVAEAERTTARLDLEFCEVRAPIDGRITRNWVDAGNLVGHGLPTPLARVVATKPLFVTVALDETDLLAIRRARIAKSPSTEPGQIATGEWWPVDLALPDAAEFSVHGRIEHVDPQLDARSGTIAVRCRFENDDELMLPGLFVRLRFPMATERSLLAPDTALLSDQGGRYALVVGDGDEVQVRRVEVGALDGTMRVVRSGLQTTDRVVVNGLFRARPGAKVKPVFATE